MRYPLPALPARMHFIDALRGIAAVWVMLFHFFAQEVSPIHDQLAATLPGWIAWILDVGRYGVDIFFVLSGFVIAFSMDGKVANLRYAGNFILRRSLRLDPAYWAAIAIVLGYLLCRYPTQWHDFYIEYGGVKGLASNLFYLQNLSWFYPANSIIGVSWTLCLEIQFYLSYLAILVASHFACWFMAARASTVSSVLAALAVAAVGCWSFAIALQQPNVGFSGQAWLFFLGIAVFKALTRGAPLGLMAPAMAALLALFVWRQDVASTVGVITAAAIYIIGIRGQLSTALAWRPLLHLGKISYSLYLLHLVIGLNFFWLLPALGSRGSAFAWLAFSVAIALSLGGAELLHRLVEAPSNRLSQKFRQRRPT